MKLEISYRYIATFRFLADTSTTIIGKFDGILVLMKAGAIICKNAGSEQASDSTRDRKEEDDKLLWQHGGGLYLGNEMMGRRKADVF